MVVHRIFPNQLALRQDATVRRDDAETLDIARSKAEYIGPKN